MTSTLREGGSPKADDSADKLRECNRECNQGLGSDPNVGTFCGCHM